MTSHKNFEEFDGALDVDEQQDIDEPKMYKVILHNDHYTTMEFVIEVLMRVFHMTLEQAQQIMLDVHKKGKGICGVYTYDIAATRVQTVTRMAEQRQFPLKCSFEEA